MKETFFQTYTRTALKANFKKDDSVPILRTPILNVFGSEVREIDKMSKVSRAFEHGWYVFAALIVGFMSLVGIIVLLQPDVFEKLGILGTIVLVLIWLFSLIQFTSFVGYFRYRLKR